MEQSLFDPPNNHDKGQATTVRQAAEALFAPKKEFHPVNRRARWRTNPASWRPSRRHGPTPPRRWSASLKKRAEQAPNRRLTALALG